MKIEVATRFDDYAELKTLSSDELWKLGFNLDDVDYIVKSDKKLHSTHKVKYTSSYDGSEQSYDVYEPASTDLEMLMWHFNNHCVGFIPTKYKKHWYYTVHHS